MTGAQIEAALAALVFKVVAWIGTAVRAVLAVIVLALACKIVGYPIRWVQTVNADQNGALVIAAMAYWCGR